MKNLLISSNKSGGGKTTFTICLMKALMDKNFKVQGYKTGPDYIDTRFHSLITGIDSRNLDSVLMRESDIKESFFKSKGDINIIEGVMGFYDGLGIDTNGSAYKLSEDYNLPVLLVLSPKAQLLSFVAELKGLLEFRKNNIIGIVLTNISKSYYEMIKECVERELDVKLFGYFESLKDLQFESRHLGLVQSIEIENILDKVKLGADSLSNTLDMDSIISSIESFNFKYEEEFLLYKKSLEKSEIKKTTIKPKCSIALDKAFSFYYKDNLDLLEEHFVLNYFSPINDIKVPDDTDFLYIGGGYPEVFKEELSDNKSMRESIKAALESGIPCYAECGGLMYLTKSIDGLDMVGFINGESEMTDRLQHFGYCNGKIKNGPLKDRYFIGHEFHKSIVISDEENISKLYKTSNPSLKWDCGYYKNNCYAHYAHIHFSTSDILDYFLKLSIDHFNKNSYNK